MGACSSSGKAPSSQPSDSKTNPLIKRAKNPNKPQPQEGNNEQPGENQEGNNEQPAEKQDMEPAPQENEQPDNEQSPLDMENALEQNNSMLSNTLIQQVQPTEQNEVNQGEKQQDLLDEVQDQSLHQAPVETILPAEEALDDMIKDFSEERLEKVCNDNFSDLKFINVNFLDLTKEKDLQTFLESEFLQVLLQCQITSIRQIIDLWKVDQVTLFNVGCNLYDQMGPNMIKYKYYNNENMIKHVQEDVTKHLKEFTVQIRKKKLNTFKNAQFGSKFLEVIAESQQLIFQQLKATKQVSLVRQKEQYTELLVRKVRKYQALGMTQDPLYLLMRQQLPLLQRQVIMNISWWRPEKGNYSNLFYYLDNRYFNLKGLIQYEIILSSKQAVVPGCSYMGLKTKLKSPLQDNMSKEGLQPKIGESMNIQELDVSGIMEDAQLKEDVDENEIKNMDEFVRNL